MVSQEFLCMYHLLIIFVTTAKIPFNVQGGERHAKFYIEDSSLIINMVSYKLS